ncbi:MAG: hypothetical protein AMS17_13595 [Spirochaetes bacterium DG_61]|nr:MAG: hypothetical protein AMS17_13595 [Spirochaetes bacterium DG_61]
MRRGAFKSVEGKVPFGVILSGITILLVISSVSLLHTNQYEFIYLRFSGLSLRSVSYFDTVLYASYLIGSILIGMLADRLGRRKIFLISGSIGSLLFFYLMIRAPLYWILLLFRFCQGVCTVSEWQILMTLVLDYSNEANRGRSFGVFGMFLALSMGIGPVFGGIIAGRGVFLPYYTAMALHALVIIISIILVKEPSILMKRPNLAQSVLIIRDRPALLIPSLFNFIDRLHIGFILFILPLYIQMVLGMGPEIRGMTLGVHALPFIALQYPVGRLSDRYGRFVFLLPGSLGYGLLLAFAGYLGGRGLFQLGAVFFVLGVFSGLTGPTNAALVGDLISREEHGMAVALFNFSGNVGIVIGPVLAGWITDMGSFAFSFVVAGAVELASLGVCVLLMKRLSVFPSSQHSRSDN